MGTEREGGDDMGPQRRSGQDVGNNHNLADVYFYSNFYYIKTQTKITKIRAQKQYYRIIICLGPLPSMSLRTGALAVYTDILKTRHVHFHDNLFIVEF